MEKYIDEEMLKEEISKRIFYLVDASSFVAENSSDYTTIQFKQVGIMNEKGYSSGAIDCSIDLYDDEIMYLSAAQIGYISPSRGIWNPSIMSVKKTKISMKPFIQNEDIICMRKNGKVSYHAQFASAAIVKTHNKMMTNWDDYNDESEEYVISASLGYSLYNNMGGSLVDLQTKVTTLEDTVSGLQSQIDDLKTSGGGGSGGNSSTAEVAKRLEKNCSLWGQSFNGTTNVDGSVFLGKMNEGIIYVQSTPYTLRLGNIVIQANASGTELTIKNATSSTTQVALKVSGNVIGYV